MFTLQHTRHALTSNPNAPTAARVRYLTVQNGQPLWGFSGTGRNGVGVAYLKTWKTRAGVESWMKSYPTWLANHGQTGTIEIVGV
jgi:hypothetical protein